MDSRIGGWHEDYCTGMTICTCFRIVCTVSMYLLRGQRRVNGSNWKIQTATARVGESQMPFMPIEHLESKIGEGCRAPMVESNWR